MKQQTLAGFARYRKMTRRGQFLAQMDPIVPWSELVAVVEPFYPKVGQAGGRPPIPLERMLRVYFLQLWFNLSDPALEEALYDVASMRSFAGIAWGRKGHRMRPRYASSAICWSGKSSARGCSRP
jgi:IS5 family transposase